MKENLRGYFFGNFYLSSIQQGIQSAHVIQEMIAKYSCNTANIFTRHAANIFTDWCLNDKTMILLNGGMHQDIYQIFAKLNSLTNQGKTYPVAYFQEERAALNDAITCAGIVLPERVYNLAYRGGYTLNVSPEDVEINELISQYKLAH